MTLAQQIDARLEVWLSLPFLIDALVAGAHADDAIVLVVKHFSAGKLREDIDARLFALLAQPGGQTIERNDVVAVILQRRRRDRRTDRARS